MNNLLKTSLLSVGLISILGLTACQSTSHTTQAKTERGMHSEHQLRDGAYHRGENHRGENHHRTDRRSEHHARGERRMPLTEEQRAQMEKMHAERKAQYEAMQKACEGKAGQNISVQLGEKTLTGSCQVHFRPDHPQSRVVPQVTSTNTVQTTS